MKINLSQSYSFCQIGGRGNQEDARYPDSDIIDSSQQFFVVCDGVGGSEKGEVASKTVCDTIGECLSTINLSKQVFDKDSLSKVIDAAYDALDKVARKIDGDMGTTMTFLCFHKGGCTMAYIGDSRIYQIRPSEGIIYRSEDHSLVNSMVRTGVISPEQAQNHPQSNVITRCMEPTGKDDTRSMATVTVTKDICPGDYFFLCTDGVLHQVSDEDLVDVLSQDVSNEAKIEKLTKMSFSSSDNNTAILVNVESVEKDRIVHDEIDIDDNSTRKIPKGVFSSSELASEHDNGTGIFGWIKRTLNL